MKTRVLLPLCVALAACQTIPELLPPPFGPDGPSSTRLFFPTGLATLPDGSLLVANGNFNHAFDGGTVVSIRKAYLDRFFAATAPTARANGIDCQKCPAPELRFGNCDPQQTAAGKVDPAPLCDDDVATHPADVFGGAVIIGNYAGPLTLNDDSTLAFTGSRDTSFLNAIAVKPDLSLDCAPGAGTFPDCRKGVLDLGAVGVLAPNAITPGDFIPPGGSPQRVLYVSAQAPRIEAISSGLLTTSALVAALDMANPSTVLFTMFSGSPALGDSTFGQGTAVGPAVFDPVRHQLLLSGCFTRFLGTGAGEPGTGRCTGLGANWLRFLDVDSQSNALVRLVDLYPDVHSSETTAILLGEPDPVTLVPTTLWATMRAPDVLVEVELPALPSVPPRIRRVVGLPIAPADLVRIPRPGRADLLGIISEGTGALVLYDTGLDQVVGIVEGLGDSPFTVKMLGEDATHAQLAATVFRACRVALIDVPLDAPWDAELRGRVGKCQ
jgi:hypothetical protein